MKRALFLIFLALIIPSAVFAGSDAFKDNIYNPGILKPTDSKTELKVGDAAPDFDLPAVSGGRVRLSDYRGKRNVVLSFIPAAWTPVCSDQWPGYNIVKELFEDNNSVLIGISVDNIPTLYAWTKQMGNLWFPVLSDFWPHGAVAKSYGILRSTGVSERAIFIIDKNGLITFIDVHDINRRPPLEEIIGGLEKISK
jgi:peroxiredoxin (alkyl hydroperoxide reductase subunit C)